MATKRENNVKSWDRIKNDPVRRAAENERKRRMYRENAAYREKQSAKSKVRWSQMTPEQKAARVQANRDRRARLKAEPPKVGVAMRKQCETCGDFFAGAGRYCTDACKDY